MVSHDARCPGCGLHVTTTREGQHRDNDAVCAAILDLRGRERLLDHRFAKYTPYVWRVFASDTVPCSCGFVVCKLCFDDVAPPGGHKVKGSSGKFGYVVKGTPTTTIQGHLQLHGLVFTDEHPVDSQPPGLVLAPAGTVTTLARTASGYEPPDVRHNRMHSGGSSEGRDAVRRDMKLDQASDEAQFTYGCLVSFAYRFNLSLEHMMEVRGNVEPVSL